jgi:hypothetical protein
MYTIWFEVQAPDGFWEQGCTQIHNIPAAQVLWDALNGSPRIRMLSTRP